jgi:dolichol-phosphate mannosyltransferase
MSTPNRALVGVATYNEIENLPGLVEEIFRHLPEADVLVIDDNSPDGTGRWADEQGIRDRRVRCLHRAGKLGLGTAIAEGIRHAIENGYTYYISIDADFSHPPRYLPALVAGMESAGQAADVMIGSRYVDGGSVEGWPLSRRLMSRAVNLYARTLLGLSARDTSGGYRCYRASRLAGFAWSAMLSRGYSFQEELLWRLQRAGCRVAELPIAFVDRVRGKSKINWREAAGALWIIFRLGLKRVLRRQ